MKIGTHDGKFHTDEVMAIALLLLLHPNAEIIRSRDPKILRTCEIIVDVGGMYDQIMGRFDHHQTGGAGTWPDGTKYSSFGLIWKNFGYDVCHSTEVYDTVGRLLVLPVDARDNGQQPEWRTRDTPSVADFIDSLNGNWDETIDEDAAFKEAVSFAGKFLRRLLDKTGAEVKAYALVRQALKTSQNPQLIILEHGLPWHRVITKEAPKAQFVILPGRTGSNEWLVQAIPVESENPRPFRRLLPETWGGLAGAALVEVTGVPDAKFSHNGGFIAIAHSQEGALALAQLALLDT